jgi:hypothetical protein
LKQASKDTAMQLQPHAFALPQKIGNKKQVVVTEWGTQKVHQGKIAAVHSHHAKETLRASAC